MRAPCRRLALGNALQANSGLELSGVIDALVAETEPVGRWRALTTSLAKLGLTQINYAFLDFDSASRMEARGDPAMSTMRPDWIEYYTERKYDMVDDAVAHVRRGNIRPMLWSLELAHRLPSGHINFEAGEAGLKSGVLVPLAGPAGTNLPGAAIMLGSGFSEAEFLNLIGEKTVELLALAHLFHAGAVGELIRRRHDVAPLTPRERDCLQFIARGMRVDAIADRLGIATVTVDLHLRAARRKLGAKTTAEAVARGLLYQQIQPT